MDHRPNPERRRQQRNPPREHRGDGGSGGRRLRADGRTGGDGGDAGPIFVGDAHRSIDLGEDRDAVALLVDGTGGNGGRGTRYAFVSNTSLPGIGGHGGRGSDIEIMGSWDVSASGENSTGLLVRSTGGDSGANGQANRRTRDAVDGGDAGDIFVTTSAASSFDLTGGAIALISQGGTGGNPLGAHDTSAPPPSPSVGGTGGAGGSITFDSSASGLESEGAWMVITLEDNAAGILLESSGGTGGARRDQDFSNGHEIAGDGGIGGDVTIAKGERIIRTNGADSPAVQAISRGGNGGASSPEGGGRGAGGDGGRVVIGGDFLIETAGDNSHGLYAGSIGGDTGAERRNAGPRAPGAGGDVVVEFDGERILTSGVRADGIRAVSHAGSGQLAASSGTVRIQVRGDVSTTGDRSSGVFAQSTPFTDDGTAGNIVISVLEGHTVSGSPGEHRAGGGITVQDGASNFLTNFGTITSKTNASGTGRTAITQITDVGSGRLTIFNHGVIDGAVRARGSGTIQVTNEAGGILIAGDRIDGDVVMNGGSLLASRDAAIGTTVIAGDLIERDGAVTVFDVDPTPVRPADAGDRLVVAGDATIAGTIVMNQVSLDGPTTGRQTVTLVRSGDDLTVDPDLAVQPSAVAQYRIIERGEALLLSYENDFANATVRAALADNPASVAGYLQSLYEAGMLSDEVARALLAVEDAVTYAGLINTLTAEVALDNQIATLDTALRFGERLMSCASTAGAGATRFYDDGQCLYAAVEGRAFNRDRSGDNLGYDGSAFSVIAGGQLTLGTDWNVGGALAYESLNVDPTGASSHGDAVFAGLSAKRRIAGFEFGASAALGYASFDTTRDPFLGGTVRGTQDNWTLSGQLRAAYLFEYGGFFAKPRVDLNVDHMFGDRYSERGGTLALAVSTDDETHVSIQPALEVGAEFALADGTRVRPHAMIGLTQFVTDPDVSLSARFANRPAGGVFTQTSDIDATRLDLAAGVDLFTPFGATIRTQGFTTLAENSQAYGGNLKLEIPF
ncbi:MAG: hypothetical protein AcusKO_47790 [Acuticoccus sp.]